MFPVAMLAFCGALGTLCEVAGLGGAPDHCACAAGEQIAANANANVNATGATRAERAMRAKACANPLRKCVIIVAP
ncbi:MAG: hypothetical protein OD817_01545 [Gammaproteobacteria bacterium]